MELYDYTQAGYNKAYSQQPPYPSSPVFMAFMAGVWCKDHNIIPQEVKPGRGYTIIINRQWKLNFKDNDYIPQVTRMN